MEKDGILTTYRGPLLVIYGRKSPRHNWRMYGSDLPENRERVERVAENWKNDAAWSKWDECQLVIATLEVNEFIPDNLPRNHKFD